MMSLWLLRALARGALAVGSGVATVALWPSTEVLVGLALGAALFVAASAVRR